MFLTTGPAFPMAGLVAIASALIFAIRYIKPEAAREYDIVFSVTGLIYSLCLLLEGQRLIPLLFFAQVLVVAMAAFFAVETFRLRLLLVEKSRQAQGRPTRREGFTRTYRPGSYESTRVVSTRSASGRRMRTADDSDRTLEEGRETPRRRSQPPQLTSDTSTSSRPRRPRPTRPIEDDIVDDVEVDEIETWEDGDDYSEPEAPQRPPRRPSGSNRPPRRPRPSSPTSRRRPRYSDEEVPTPRSSRVIQVEPIVEDVEDDDFEDDYYQS